MVYLVGAGPGDPGCLTLRGKECLSRADVVVYDYLANEELLEYAPRDATRVFAGKHGAGPHLMEQVDINAALIQHARAGRTVVRLKGGDPFVFGRGGEEAEALRTEGLPFEVVPGVTSALAAPAFAGIPVTHRDWVSGVTVLTGHEAKERASTRVDWQKVATAGNTLVLLMGVTQLRKNMARLMEAGLPDETPAAAVRWASRPQQRVLEASVAEIADLVANHQLRPPVTVVIGEVVRLRPRVSWFESRPLHGRRILVTRPRAQVGSFRKHLAERGAEVLVSPTIEIRSRPEALAELDAAIDHLEEYDWVVLTSVNGVHHFFDRLLARGRDVRALSRAKVAVIGSETARAVRRFHVVADVVPPADFRAEGLLVEMEEEEIDGARVLLPRALGAREILPDTLRQRGARVDEIATYESVLPEDAEPSLRRALDGGALDAVTFTSSSTVQGFSRLLDRMDGARAALADTRVACIGPVTAETAREVGLEPSIVSSVYTIPGLCDALTRSFQEE